MDFLLTYYTDKFANIEGNIFELFTEFYNLDLSPVDSWLQTQFENKVEKDDTLSTFYRQEGNKCYARKELLKSLELYTKSLCCATPNGQEYGLALANRSAVSFEMREFSNCLRDIELCFKTNYPKHLRPKIYLRKAECYCETGLKDELEKCMVEALQFLHIENVPDKEKHILKMNKIKKMPLKGHNNWDGHKENLYELPEFDEGESDSFKSASSKLKMSYDETRGRHVLAKKNIRKGEVLFVEKAFLFAPIFKDEKEFHPFKCYNCLKDVISSVPCHSCTLCVYCNEKCRTVSWEDCHRWECEGMQANIWCDLGIGFPALKAILKGVKSGFKTIKGDHTEDLKHFGDKDDNYPYFNRLVSHIYKNKNAAPFILVSLRSTTFYKWL